jgi:hypothetical protein
MGPCSSLCAAACGEISSSGSRQLDRPHFSAGSAKQAQRCVTCCRCYSIVSASTAGQSEYARKLAVAHWLPLCGRCRFPEIPKAAPAVVAEVPKVVSPSRNVVFPEVVASPTSARSHGPDPIPRSTAAATVVSHSKLTYQPLLYSRSGGSTMKFHPVGAEEYAQTVSELKLAKQRQLSCKPRALSAPAGKLHVDSCECDTCTANVLLDARNAALTGPRLFYRMNSSIALIHAIFRHHGFTLTKSDMFNSLWTSGHLKSYVFQVTFEWWFPSPLLCVSVGSLGHRD